MNRVHGIVRFLHFVGLAMFFGSVLAHIVLGILSGAELDPATLLVYRLVNNRMTTALALPGLGVLLVTGIWLTLRRFGGFFRHRWLTVHQVLALLVVLNAVLLLGPLGGKLMEVTRSLVAGQPVMETIAQLSRREAMFGAGNFVLTLGAMIVAVLRPFMRKK